LAFRRNERPIRLANTALGTIWIECCEPDTLHLHPWWHESCRLDGQKLPFFSVTLQRVEGRWRVAKFNDSMDPEAPKWPRGARAKLPNIILEIGTALAAANESIIRERATEHLKWEVEHLVEGRGELRWLHETIAHAKSLDRVDLLELLRSLIRALVGKFSQVNRRLAAHRGSKNRKAA
jgi:hypothetical protein